MKIGLVVNENKTKYMVMSNSETRGAPRDFNVSGTCFKGVSCFSYLCAMVSNDNKIRMSIRGMIQAGNGTYFTILTFLKTILFTRGINFKVYYSVARPVVTCVDFNRE